MRISGSNVGYTKFQGSVKVLASHSIRQFPLHFPSRASPCAITFQLDSTIEHIRTAHISTLELHIICGSCTCRNTAHVCFMEPGAVKIKSIIRGHRQAGRQAGKHAGRQASTQGSRQAGKHAGRQGGRQVGKHAGRQAGKQHIGTMVYKKHLNKVSGYIYYKYSTAFHIVRTRNYSTAIPSVIHYATL